MDIMGTDSGTNEYRPLRVGAPEGAFLRDENGKIVPFNANDLPDELIARMLACEEETPRAKAPRVKTMFDEEIVERLREQRVAQQEWMEQVRLWEKNHNIDLSFF